MWNNIPMELRALPQWVCSGPNKIPLSPRTGQAAAVNDPSTWGTFEEAVRTGMQNIGFVLTPHDPYVIIDLDNKPSKPCTPEQLARHHKILEAFDSYTERSTSGTGFHIIVRGDVHAGVHRDNVEVYSHSRYMICTGNVVRNSPIRDYTAELILLVGEMQSASRVELEDHESLLSDEELVEMGMRAANAEKFNQLCAGGWQSMGYESQSEADFALLSILAFYTLDNEQVRRIFRMSKLGQREKALRNDRYLDFALEKIRAQQPAAVDMTGLMEQTAAVLEQVEAPELKMADLSLPPGLVGEIAQYIFDTAIRPVPEFALGAAIAVTAGICGRSYNISGSGLNHYLILLAKTGAGKEGATTGIDNLVAAVRPQIPMVDQFIGPSAFASGQALIKVLDEKPCFVSVLGEFGLTLQQLCDPRASSAQVMLKKVLLDLYSKSGWNKILRSSVYSDTDKNTKIVQAPNVTILGESTPESFFEGLDSMHISEGLIPRFSVIEYTGPRPPRNRNANLPPDQGLANRFANLVVVSLTTSNNQTCANIQMQSQAVLLLDQFDIKADDKINSAGTDVDMQLWNRAHLKALKLAGVIAVGVDPHNPVVTTEIAQWAITFVERDVETMATRFRAGAVGQGDHRHEVEIRRVIEQYLTMTADQRAGYKVPKGVRDKPIVPFHYLRRKLRLLNSFKSDRRGVAIALESALQDMVKAEILRKIPLPQAMAEFGVNSELYGIGSTW